MPRLTPIHWKRLEKLFLSLGFVLIRQSASHRIYGREGLKRPLVVNVHSSGNIDVDVIVKLLKTAGISREEFLRLIDQIK